MFDMFVKESRGKWATGIFSCKVAYEITLWSILGCLWVNKKIYIAESGWQHRVGLGTAIPDVPQESLRYLKLVGLDAHGCPCAVWWQPLFLVIQSCVTGLDLNHLNVAAIGSYWLFTTCIQHEPTTSKQCPVMALLFYCFEIISSTPANGCTFRPKPCFSKMTCAVAWAKDMQVPPMAHGMEECKDMLKADAGKATKWLRVCSTFSQDSRLLDWTWSRMPSRFRRRFPL